MKASYQGKYRDVDSLFMSNSGVFRSVDSMYIANNGVWESVYASEIFAFDGTYSTQQVVIGDTAYNMHALTTAGILKLHKPTRLFLVGGGSAGSPTGNGGPGGFVNDGEVPAGTYVVEIGKGGTAGASGTATRVTRNGTDILAAEGGIVDGEGGSGYGAGGNNSGTGGKGAGRSTKPFGIESQPPHSAAGSGGDYKTDGMNFFYKGGSGGSDGSDGGARSRASSQSTLTGGTSAERGGGKGGGAYWTGSGSYDGTDATFPGSGGGGAGSDGSFGKPGNGYQGIVYVLVKSAYQPIIITKQPENVSCKLGDNVTFSIEAVNVTDYRWQYSQDGGTTWAGLFWDGAYSNSMTFNVSSTTRAANLYRCELKNGVETVYSDVVTISI